jgi:transposase
MIAFPDTLLRLVRRRPEPPLPTPAILGVEEWAMRRGRTDDTLLADLARRRPVDLLPDRTAEALAAWRRAHPGVTPLSRDRSTEHARGATLGAPEAQHVLDRWPLVRNLRKPSNACWIGSTLAWQPC